MAWVKHEGTPYDLNRYGIVNKFGDTDGYQMYIATADSVRVHIRQSGDLDEILLTSLVSGWNHVAYAQNGTQMLGYTNGALTDSKTSTIITGIGSNTLDLLVGKEAIKGTFFNGTIAEVLIYNRAWTADEVLSYYNATKGRFGL